MKLAARKIGEIFGQPGDQHRLLAMAWCDLYKVALDTDLDQNSELYEGVREWLRDATPQQFGALLRVAYTHGLRDHGRD